MNQSVAEDGRKAELTLVRPQECEGCVLLEAWRSAVLARVLGAVASEDRVVRFDEVKFLPKARP